MTESGSRVPADARPAGPPPQPAAEPVQVERRVSSRGAITIARQRTLTVESADHTFRIYDGRAWQDSNPRPAA
jgi:hypothetical protein